MVKEKKGFFERVESEVTNAVKTYAAEKIKKNLIKFGEISALVVVAIFLISFGVADLAAYYFPILANGLSYVLLGVLFLIIGMLISY